MIGNDDVNMESADALWFALAHLGVWKPRHWLLFVYGDRQIVSAQISNLGADVGLHREWRHRLPDDVLAAILKWEQSVADDTERHLANKPRADIERDVARDLCRKYLDWLGNPPHPKDTAPMVGWER
jgi:hypothetical protein